MKSPYAITCALLAMSTVGFTAAPCEKKASAPAPAPSSCSAPCQAQGEPMMGKCPAYNAPAAVNVNHKMVKCRCPDINYFVDFAFNYWFAGEDGLTLATKGVSSGGVAYSPVHATALIQKSNYKPGFKIGAGIVGHNDWVVQADYTWYRATNTTHSGSLATLPPTPTAGTSIVLLGAPAWVVSDWFLQRATAGGGLAGSSVASKWRLGVDLIDAVASRPYYQGPRLTMTPFAGLRVALIRQSMTVTLQQTALTSTVAATAYPVIGSRNYSHSWGIGPRVGFDGNVLLPQGFRLEGDFAGSLLYTRYNVRHGEDAASSTFNGGQYTTSMHGYSALRPAAELGLGFGWGRYLYCKDYHIDFSADYDFMVFWSQNMLRKLLDDSYVRTGGSSGDLFLHGLTITGRFDF